jgi:FlaG/FlaF family flagellin (archaellin)
VIGVILMVAITVILAAVIATFVLGLGDQVSSPAPQASFDFNYEEDAGPSDFEKSASDANVTVTHTGGVSIVADQLGVTGGADGRVTWDQGPFDDDDKISAGNSLIYAMNSTDTVRVTWESQDGTRSATLQTFDGPDA